MSRIPLDSRVICSASKVWYIAVEGHETLSGAMANLHEFATRIERDRIWSVIIDMRRLTAYPPAPDWTIFCDRVRMATPSGIRVAVLSPARLPKAPLAQFLRAAQDGGGEINAYHSWADAVAAVGLPAVTAEPLTDHADTLYVD